MATILVTRGIPDENLKLLKGHKVFYPGLGKGFSTAEMVEILPQIDGIIAAGRVNKEMMDLAPNLKIISNFGAGYDLVDVNEATKRNILVTNTPSYTAVPTAEIAIGLILATARKICQLDKNIREFPKAQFGLDKYTGFALEKKTLGIIGMGNIGGIVADFGKIVDMNVLYYNRRELSNDKNHGAKYVPLEELLKESDVISIHVPLTQETQNILSKERLGLIKQSAIVVNTARGGVMDYEALISILQEGKIAGAGLDVFPDEPNVPEGLLSLENVVLTPHIGTNALNARNRMTAAACQSILDFLAGKEPESIVNKEIYKNL